MHVGLYAHLYLRGCQSAPSGKRKRGGVVEERTFGFSVASGGSTNSPCIQSKAADYMYSVRRAMASYFDTIMRVLNLSGQDSGQTNLRFIINLHSSSS